MNVVQYMATSVLRKQQKKEFLRREILDAARTTFAREGYDSFSMRTLASEIGCSPGTIYLYFRDRNELLQEVVEASFSGLLKVLQSIPVADDPEFTLRERLRAYIEFGLEHPDHYRCAFLLPVRKDQPYRVHPAFDLLRDSVKDCVNRGVFRSVEVEVASQVLWSCIHGITSLLISRSAFPWVARETLINELLNTTIAGMIAPARDGRR